MARRTEPTGRGSGSWAGRPAVVYFAKNPRPGQVKTRLCPPLTLDEAAGLYGAFLRACARPVPGARAIVYGWPEAELGALAAHLEGDLEVRPQRGADLWERIVACMDELFAEGHSAVVLRNTDAPDLPRERVTEAIAACAPGRAVFGPDADGGYYLVGLSAPCPELFLGQPDVDDTVLERTEARARGLGLEPVRIAAGRDVDTFDDLLAMWRRRGGG